MNLGINSKVIIYTGAAGLIGQEACRKLAEEGASLCLVDPAESRLKDLESEILRDLPNARIMTYGKLNGLDKDDIEAFLDQVESKLGAIDCLVNSAYPRTTDWHLKFEDIPFSSWQKNIDDHLNGYFLISQAVSKRMIRSKSGNIVNFASIYGLVGPDFGVYEGLGNMTMPAAYSAIKGGIVNLTRYLASYLGPHGIRVNAICPGGVKDQQAEMFIRAYEKRVPMKRMATTKDVIGPLLFLISDMSAYVNGVALPVDGGWTAI